MSKNLTIRLDNAAVRNLAALQNYFNANKGSTIKKCLSIMNVIVSITDDNTATVEAAGGKKYKVVLE